MMRWVGVLMLALGCSSVPVEETEDSRRVQSIVRNTSSPFCPGKTLDSCPSPRAAGWRQDINAWVEEGVPSPEIRERLQERVPGFSLDVEEVESGWIIPVVAVAVSTLWLIFVGRALRGPMPPRRSRAPIQSDELDARLDEELSRVD